MPTSLRKMLEGGNCVYSDLFPILSALYATRSWDKEPLWIMIVGPPGSGKTFPMSLMKEAVDVKTVSALTPAALISGWGGELVDCSLLAELNDKLLMAKDFGTILSMNWNQANEVFGILREAFDGYISKNFGMLRREYRPHFNFAAATTEFSERYDQLRSQLGERFLRYNHSVTPLPIPPPRVKNGLDKEVVSWMESLKGVPRTTDVAFLHKQANIIARLRTNLVHAARSDEVMEVPEFEGEARLYFQLEKLYKGLLLVNDGSRSESERLVRKVSLSCVSRRKVKVLQCIHAEDGVQTNKIAEDLRLGYGVVRRVLNDFYVLKLLERELQGQGYPKTFVWHLAPAHKDDLVDFLTGQP